ncbi:unnamed protein product, partial [Mesorhabditis belari]|uniref:Uncharacterized protein n=1 Tax=Mesorhabditis belari TaxID=2138241 RepID=A0AAF3EP64_9BILA
MALFISNLFILFLFDLNWAKYSRGIIATTSEYMPWVYLDRFCFVTEMGTLNFTIRYPTDIGVQSLLLYYDTPDQWDAVYDTALTCEQRVAVLDPENNQQIKLTPSDDRFDSTIIGWLSYLISSITTATKYPAKRSFYYVLGALMTFWFFMGPISLLIANFVLDDWVREEVVNLVECCVTFYGFFVFTILTWPSSANHNFPFHVRTTQIGDSYQGDFPQSTYEVRYSNGNGEANIEQIRELSPGMMRNGMVDERRSTANTPR